MRAFAMQGVNCAKLDRGWRPAQGGEVEVASDLDVAGPRRQGGYERVRSRDDRHTRLRDSRCGPSTGSLSGCGHVFLLHIHTRRDTVAESRRDAQHGVGTHGNVCTY